MSDRPSKSEKIEVTPEMRAAGGEIFASFFDYFEHADDIAEEIYREMELARRFKPGEYPRSSLRGP